MSNNTMAIKCDVCDELFYIAKYYPETNWYGCGCATCNSLEEFFGKHHHEQLNMRGPIHFSLHFEFGEDCATGGIGYMDRKFCGPNRFTEKEE